MRVGTRFILLCKGINDFFWRLYQFNQDSIAAIGSLFIALGVNKGNIMSSRSSSNASWCKANAFGFHPRHGLGQVVDPQANMIERWNVYLNMW